MKRNLKLYIKDILKYMERAEAYTKDITFESFASDNKTCDAVVRCIEIIGEATKNVPFNIRAKYPEVPWRAMAGMRDKIIHSYFEVNYENVWLVVKEEIPKIKPHIIKILEEMGEDS